jgi:hypothetical protein
MSEIRQTTSIEMMNVPAPEPTISLRELLIGLNWLQTANSPAEALRAPAPGLQPTLTSTCSVLSNEHGVGSALAEVNALAGLEVPKSAAGALQNRIGKLAVRNDSKGLEKLRYELIQEHQQRQQTALQKLVSDACNEIGFAVDPQMSRYGIVIGRSGGRTLTVEVARSKSGDLRLHMDADGFHGSACVESLNRLEQSLARRGIRFKSPNRQRKDRRPAFDGRRMCIGNQARPRA